MATSLVASGFHEVRDQVEGHGATTPWQFGWPAWKQVLARTWKESSDDNIGLVAAGVAFYAFLAIVPLLGSIVLLYGLIADAETVLHDIRALVTTLPAYAAKLIAHQLVEIVTASTDKKGLGLLAALALTLFGARNAAAAVIMVLNIAYEESETRTWVRQTLLALAMTLAGVLLAFIAVLAIAALGHLEALLPTLPDPVLIGGKILSYLLLTLGGAAGAATLYRYGPNRAAARWVWLTPGSVASGLGWLFLTLGFGIYVAHVDDYSATYGSLSAIVVLLIWFFLSSYILMLVAELNSELEHQTARDTTEGKDSPLGTRNAWAADHVAGEPLTSHNGGSPLSDDPVDDDKIKYDEPRSVMADAVAIRATAATSRLVGLGRIGAVPSVAAAAGLVLLRRRGKALAGGTLFFAAGALAFLGRHGQEEKVLK